MGSRRRQIAVCTFSLLALVAGGSVAGTAASATTAAAAASLRARAVAIPSPPGPGSVTGGGSHLCVLTGAGGGKCWGYNLTGGLGDGTTTARAVPVGVSGYPSGLSSIAAGGQTTCAVTDTGGAKCWGWNGDGQVGDGTNNSRSTPVDVSGLTSGVAAVSVGYFHACAVTTAGGVKCWGATNPDNNYGQLGNGTTVGSRTPVDVSGLASGVAAIATGLGDRDHTCALTTAGGVKCWGANNLGQLGDGTTTNRLTPVDVSGLTTGVAAIYAGGMHTCAITTMGGAKCWGDNDGGQLGDGTTTTRLTPVDVSGLTSGVADMALSQSSFGYGPGRSHTCAVTAGGAVKCWGRNTEGQAGDGTEGNNRLTPVDVVGLGSGFVAVATSFWTGCAVGSSGAVRCWGAGGTGDGTSLQRLTPVDVSGSFFRDECPTLIATAHTSFSMSDGYAAGSVATFVADPGFTLIGEPVLSCQGDLTWDHPVPTVPAPPKVVPGLARVVEGDAGSVVVEVPVRLSAPSAVTVTARWVTIFGPGVAPPDPAVPGVDFEAASGVVTFVPGDTEEVASITVYGDTVAEPDEFIVAAFHSPTNAVMGGFWGLGFGVITNDDAPPP